MGSGGRWGEYPNVQNGWLRLVTNAAYFGLPTFCNCGQLPGEMNTERGLASRRRVDTVRVSAVLWVRLVKNVEVVETRVAFHELTEPGDALMSGITLGVTHRVFV